MGNYKYEALFEELKRLMASLSQGEVAHATMLLTQNKKYRSNGGVLRLYKLLRTNPEITWGQAMVRLGFVEEQSALRKATKRLLMAISDSITDRVSAMRKGNLPASQQAKAIGALDLIKLPELSARGLTVYLDEVIDDIIKRATQSEDFKALAEALYSKQVRLINKGAFSEADVLANQWHHATNEDAIITQLNVAAVRIAKRIATSGNTTQYALETFEVLTACQALAKGATSERAKFMIMYLESDWLYVNGFVRQALELRLAMFELARNQKKFTLASTLWTQLSIADCYIRLFHFEQAAAFTSKVKIAAATVSPTWWRVREQEVELACYRGNWKQADELLRKLIARKREPDWLYSKAVIAFARGDFFSAFVNLQDVDELQKDRSGYWLGIRLLKCLTLLARYHDSTEHSGKALLQWYNRLDKSVKEKLRERDVLLIEAIVAMACEPIPGSGGLSADVSPQLEQLRAHPWEPFTYEVFDIAAMLGRIFKQRKWFTAAAPIELFEPLAVYRQAAAEQQAAQPPFKPAV